MSADNAKSTTASDDVGRCKRCEALEAENERLREELNCANEQIPAQIRAALAGRLEKP